jgi:hypothetical protein
LNFTFALAPAGAAAIPPMYHLQLKGTVLNNIRHKLSAVNGNDLHDDRIDDIVLSILYLAVSKNLDQIRPPEKSPFSPPFRRLQSTVAVIFIISTGRPLNKLFLNEAAFPLSKSTAWTG